MCPRCGGVCSYWRLRESCYIARLASVFDNKATVFFASFMAVWSLVFVELWKRKQMELRHDWHVTAFKPEERVRPDIWVGETNSDWSVFPLGVCYVEEITSILFQRKFLSRHYSKICWRVVVSL